MSFEKNYSYLSVCFKYLWMMGSSLTLLTPTAYAKTESLSMPSHPNAKSLLFDQNFDAKPFRPLFTPELLNRYIAQNSSKNENVLPSPSTSKITSAALVSPVADSPVLASIVETPSPIPTPPAPAIASVENTPSKDFLVESFETRKPASKPSLIIAQPNSLASQSAALLVLDETGFINGNLQRVPEAVVHWLHPRAGLSSKVDSKGRARIPYPKAYSSRYVVTAPGYLPAVGYAVKGLMSPVLLYKESRLGPILKSLDQNPRNQEHFVLGKFLDHSLKAIPQMSFDEFFQDTRKAFYSSGVLGIFTPNAKQSGPQGDFLLAHLPQSLQYLLPKQTAQNVEIVEWPAQMLDLKGLSPVVSTTLLAHKESSLNTRFVDSFSGEKPNTGIYVSIGGQRGVFEPDINGFVDLNDISLRPNIDLIEVYAQGYLKSWLNSSALSETIPDSIPLFTQHQLQQVLSPLQTQVTLNQSYIVGNLRAESYKNSVRFKVFNSLGQVVNSARINYFGKDGQISPNQTQLDLKDPRFVITQVPEGEHHIVALDSVSGQGISIQVVRTQAGTVSNVQF